MAGYSWIHVKKAQDGRLLIPPNAVEAGEERGYPVYVARVARNDIYILGKLSMWVRRIGYSLNGSELEVDEGEVLVGSENRKPVWVTGAFGEEVDGVVGCPGVHGHEYVGRTLHKGSWVPGKVVPKYNCMYYPYAGESSTRKYQLLSSELTWIEDRSSIQGCDYPVSFAPDESAASGSVIRYRGREMAPEVLSRSSTEAASYLNSGDGEWIRGAIVAEANKLVGRAYVNGKWQLGTLTPGDAGLRFANCQKHAYSSYEILLARPILPKSQQLLLMTIKASEAEMQETSEDTIAVCELQPGESAWSVAKEILGDMQSLGEPPSTIT